MPGGDLSDQKLAEGETGDDEQEEREEVDNLAASPARSICPVQRKQFWSSSKEAEDFYIVSLGTFEE